MTDRTTKLLLALIALGLFANALMPLLRPTPARAAQTFACDGTMKPNVLGSDYGSDISVRCQ